MPHSMSGIETQLWALKYPDEIAAILNNTGVPSTPTLLFVSDGSVEKGWIDHHKWYISITSNVKMVELDCGHMMHNHCSEIIAATAKEYIRSLR